MEHFGLRGGVSIGNGQAELRDAWALCALWNEEQQQWSVW